MKFILATNNAGKLEEFRRMTVGLGIELTTARELGIVPPDPEETGETFAENARIKAAAFMEASGLPAIADDSGLCVDALNGRPGVHSARYGGDHDFATGIDRLLGELEGVPAERRTARFICHICCVWPDGRELNAEGACEGSIGFERLGDGGFGFDPVFLLTDGRCFGAISDGEKDAASHRGRALESFAQELDKLRRQGAFDA